MREKPSLECIKQILLDLEAKYTEFGVKYKREWEIQYIRELTRSSIKKSDSVQELAEQMVKIQGGMYRPYFYKYNTDKDEDQSDDKQDESKIEENYEPEIIAHYRSWFPVKIWPN